MLLAACLRDYPGELRADFQQYYGLNLDDLGSEYTTLHAGVLLEQLPEGSRVHRAIDPDNVWTLDRQLLAALVNAVNWLVWSKTKDGQRGRNKPKPIGLQARKPQNAGEKKIAGKAMDRDEFMAALQRIHGK